MSTEKGGRNGSINPVEPCLVSRLKCEGFSSLIWVFFAASLNEYNVYDLPDQHAINAYFHLKKYIVYIETHHLGRPLHPDEFVFGSLSVNGTLDATRPIAPHFVQEWLDKAVKGAKIPAMDGYKFTTHCFRRGGAQYRFTLAPPSQRWTLDCIRWWGGWADGESVSAYNMVSRTGMLMA